MQGNMPNFQGPRAAQVLASQIGAGLRGNQAPSEGGNKRANNNSRSDSPLGNYTAQRESTASNPFGINFKTMG